MVGRAGRPDPTKRAPPVARTPHYFAAGVGTHWSPTMSTQLYTQAYVTFNGKILMEHASVTITRTSGSQAVTTVGHGYAGESLGAPTVEIDVTNAVPVAGYEQNMQDYIESLEVVELGVIAAGQAMTSKGFIISDSFKHAVNQESTYDFKFRGTFARFE